MNYILLYDHLNANHHSLKVDLDLLLQINTIATYYFQIKLFLCIEYF